MLGAVKYDHTAGPQIQARAHIEGNQLAQELWLLLMGLACSPSTRIRNTRALQGFPHPNLYGMETTVRTRTSMRLVNGGNDPAVQLPPGKNPLAYEQCSSTTRSELVRG